MCAGVELQFLSATKDTSPEKQLSEDEAVALLLQHGFSEGSIARILEEAESTAKARRARLERFWDQGRRRHQLAASKTLAKREEPGDSSRAASRNDARLGQQVAHALQPYSFLSDQKKASSASRRVYAQTDGEVQDMDEEQAAHVLRECGFSKGMIQKFMQDGCAVLQARRLQIERYHAKRRYGGVKSEEKYDGGSGGDSEAAGARMLVHKARSESPSRCGERPAERQPRECASHSSPVGSKSRTQRHRVVVIQHDSLASSPCSPCSPCSPRSSVASSPSDIQDYPTTHSTPARPAGPGSGASPSRLSHPAPRAPLSSDSSRPMSAEKQAVLQREKERLRAERECALRMLRK